MLEGQPSLQFLYQSNVHLYRIPPCRQYTPKPEQLPKVTKTLLRNDKTLGSQLTVASKQVCSTLAQARPLA